MADMKGPYAPVQNVLAVIHRMRDRGLPERVDLSALLSIGIAEGNAPRTLAALKFLGLVGDDDRRTPLFDRIGKAATDDYEGMLAEVIRESYAPIFTIVDPAQDGEMRIADAFRQYEPSGQRERMVTLFMGLCEEAGIIEKRTTSAPNVRAKGTVMRPRAIRRKQPDNGVTGRVMPPTQPPNTTSVDASLLFGVTDEDVAALGDDDFNEVWAALGKVARARARARMAAQARATQEEVAEDALIQSSAVRELA